MSTNARDELAKDIARVLVATNPNQAQVFDDLLKHGQRRWLSRAIQVADSVLAAGWRKPRTITTAEELDELNPNAVLMWIDDAGLTHTVCAAVVQMSAIEMWPMDVLWTPEEGQ